MAAKAISVQPYPDITPAALTLLDASALVRLWHRKWCVLESDGWSCSRSGAVAGPRSAGVFPLDRATGGPGGLPYLQAQAADPTGVLRTAASVFPTAGDWTVFAIANFGTTAAAAIFSIVGADGGSVGFLMRSTNIWRVVKYDAAMAQTVLLSYTAPAPGWYYVAASWYASTGTMRLYANGALVATSAAGLTIAYGTSRVAFFDTDDTVDEIAGEGRGAAVALLGVCNADISKDPALKAKIDAFVDGEATELVP